MHPKAQQIHDLLNAGRFDQARVMAQRLAQSLPRDAGAQSLMSYVLLALGQTTQALHFSRRALALRPDEPSLMVELGRLLAIESTAAEAEQMLRRAVEGAPRHVGARRGLASVLVQQNRFTDAAAQCRAGLDASPDDTGLASSLAACLLSMGLVEDAAALMRQECERHPDDATLRGGLALVLNYLPEADAAQVFDAHKRYGELMTRLVAAPPRVYAQAFNPDRRLRIGIVSPDLRSHSVAFFMEPLLQHHNRDAVELYVYQTNRIADAMTRRLTPHAAVWRVMDNISDAGLAEAIFADRVDILIELSGHTHANSLAALHARPAPVQATYLGYPNTTGLAAIDRRIVDSITDPAPQADALATERLLRLDPCFLCYQPPADAPTPSQASGPGAVTFGSFNAIQKLNRRVVAVWSRLLREVEGSRLVLKGMNFADEQLRQSVVARFERDGVAPGRVEILPPASSVAEHLALYARVDVALDPFPYCGTTTTCEALWMGVPVVTLTGGTHASRVGASLLSCVGLADLIAHSEEEYIALACTLALDAPRRRSLRSTLRERMRASTLCDGPGFSRRFEAALRDAWRERCAAG